MLVAILLPALTSARESARQAMCLVNFRQLGQVIWQYAHDCDDWIVPSRTDPSTNPYGPADHYRWPRRLIYLKYVPDNALVENKGVLDCPTILTPLGGFPHYCEYGFNVWLAGQGETGLYLYHKMNRVYDTSITLMAMDNIHPSGSEGISLSYTSVYYCHQNKANTLYVDGHATWASGYTYIIDVTKRPATIICEGQITQTSLTIGFDR